MGISKHGWMLGEIHKWQSEGLVSEEQAQLLSCRYSQKEVSAGVILPLLGAILLGVGIVLFFAANWPVLPVGVKLLLIFSVFILCQHWAYLYRYAKAKVWLGDSLLLLGGLLFGAAIFLIAQIYHIQAYYPNGILFWSLGVLVMAWATREHPLTILALVLLLIWAVTDLQETEQMISWLHLLALFLLAFPVAYRANSPMAVFLALVMLLLILAFSFPGQIGGGGLFYWLLLGSVLFLRGKHSDEPYPNVYLFIGLLVGMATLFIGTFNPMEQPPVLTPELLGRTALAPLALILAGLLPGFKPVRRDTAILAGLNLAFIVHLTMGLPHLWIYFILFAALVLALAQGADQHNLLQFNMSLFFFYLAVIRGYFDYASHYLDRGWFFILGGVLLLAMGWWLNRQRGKIVATWREAA